MAQRGRKIKLHFLHFTTLTNLNFTMIVSLIESFYKSSKFFFLKAHIDMLVLIYSCSSHIELVMSDAVFRAKWHT